MTTCSECPLGPFILCSGFAVLCDAESCSAAGRFGCPCRTLVEERRRYSEMAIRSTASHSDVDESLLQMDSITNVYTVKTEDSALYDTKLFPAAKLEPVAG